MNGPTLRDAGAPEGRRPPRSTASWLWLAVIIALTAGPLVVLVGMIARHMADVPFWDQWELVAVLRATRSSELTFYDIWKQHNEHRLVFPVLVMLGLAGLTDWNTTWELCVGVLLAAGTFVVLALQTRRLQRQSMCEGTLWYLPAMSLLVFSLSQWENWLWGWQFQIYMNIIAVTGALCLLARSPRSRWTLAGAALLAIVATYSFANGMLVWPLGLLVIGLVPGGGRRRQWAHALLWAVAAVAVAATYLCGYLKPSYHPPLCSPLSQPGLWSAYVGTYLGASMAKCRQAGSGAMGVVIFTATAGLLLLRRRTPVAALAPFVALASYAVLSAALTGCGRAAFGVGQALAPRYIPFAHLLWLSSIAQLSVLASPRVSSVRPDRSFRMAVVIAMAAVLTMFLIASACTHGALAQRPLYDEHRALLMGARAKMLVPATEMAGLSEVCPEPEDKLDDLHYLREQRLSLFRAADP